MKGTAPARERRLAVVAVGAQGLLLGWLGWPARSPQRSGRALVGRGLSVGGLLVAASAARAMGRSLTPSPVPTAHVEVVRRGPFASVRHPIYSGLLVFAGGRVLSVGRRRLLPGVLLAVLLNVKSRWEERLLTARRPDYQEYAASTPRFLPKVLVLRR